MARRQWYASGSSIGHNAISDFSRLASLILAAAALACAADPIRLHPESPRYFLFRSKPTVLVTSGEHYGAVLNLDFDYRVYLRELRRHGLNLTRTFTGVYREVPGSFNITANTLAPRPARDVLSPDYAEDVAHWITSRSKSPRP